MKRRGLIVIMLFGASLGIQATTKHKRAVGSSLVDAHKLPTSTPEKSSIWYRQWHSSHDWHFKTKHWFYHTGWWGGYWWGWDPYIWQGRMWGLGYTAYPWYWKNDEIALITQYDGLMLYQLAERNRWDDAVTAVENSIQRFENARHIIQQTTNDIKEIRRVERKIDRLERYLEDIAHYRGHTL